MKITSTCLMPEACLPSHYVAVLMSRGHSEARPPVDTQRSASSHTKGLSAWRTPTDLSSTTNTAQAENNSQRSISHHACADTQ